MDSAKRIFKRSYSDVVSGTFPTNSSPDDASRLVLREELFENYYPSYVASSISSIDRTPVKKCAKRIQSPSSPISFSFDAPVDERAFHFNPPVEIAVPEREPISRKRPRVEDENVKIPTAKRFCPSPPRSNNRPPSYLRPLIERRRRQYGGGPVIKEFKKKEGFPTQEEKDFFHKYVELSKDVQLKRQNDAYTSLEPMRLKFVNLDQVAPDNALYVHVANLIDIFIRMMIENAGGNLKDTRFWFQLNHEGYHEDQGFFITHKTYATVDGGVIVNQISTHMQSNKNICLDGGFTVAMSVFKERARFVKGAFRGNAKKRLRGRGPRKSESIKNTLLEVNFGVKQNRVIGSSHCVAKAILLGKMETDIKVMDAGEEKEKLKQKLHNLMRPQISLKTREEKQLQLAKEFLENLGMDSNQEEHGLEDIEEIAAEMPDYQFIVWSIEGRHIVANEVTRLNPDGTKFIGLFYHRRHYEFVSHIKGAKPSRFCYKCFKFGDSNHPRKCDACCRRCGSFKCQPGNAKIHCNTCNIDFRSQKCFDAHKNPTSVYAFPFCEKYFFCQSCLTIDRTDKYRKVPHMCGTKDFCPICREKVKKNHECSYRVPTTDEKKKLREKQEKWKVLVYDMECIVANSGTYEEDAVRGPKHEPNMICARMFCSECHGEPGCQMCGEPWYYSYQNCPSQEESLEEPEEPEESDSEDEDFDVEKEFHVEERHTPLAQFGRFLLRDPRANNCYIIAHNGGGYDHPLLLGEIDRQGGVKAKEPKVILNGLKIISVDYRFEKQHLFFRDSALFLPMRLARMPAAFGLDGEAKGMFPYLFNHPDNYNTRLSTLPPKEYYSPKYMVPEARSEFDKWYAECYNEGFELHEEMLKYCESDVRILTLTLIKFIKMCSELFNGWNPIVHGTTLASFSMFVMKAEYIQNGDIGYIPESGYGRDNNSMLALKYIQWLEKQEPGLRLQYMLRGGEYQMVANGCNYKVDAFNKDTKEAYEIHGCLWHGCPKCQPIRDKWCKVSSNTPQEAYARTMRKEEDIRNAGYTLHTIWECEINEMLEKNSEMRNFFKLNKYTRRLNPREGVFGGRTQVFRSITEADEETLIDYYDVMSMYPYLNAGGTAYPRGNPQVLVDTDLPSPTKPLTCRGIVFCDCLPAKDAEIGYLPMRSNQKLMFPLCRSCAEDPNVWGQCTHYKVSERYLTGVWTTDELNKAISRGYKVLKYHEIWHWPDKDWITGGFFAKYIKPLLTIKYQSSGWPRPDMKDEEKKKYVDEIKEKDGVDLDVSKMQKNTAMRSLSKIFLNSAWGKFAQNPMRNETRLVLKSDAKTITNFFNDPLYEPTMLKELGDKKVWISRKPKKESVRGVPFTNLPIGIITPSAGRLRLMEGIERVGVKNMIYCDTDSLMFKRKPDEDPLGDLKGEHLGFFVSEVPEGKAIKEAVCSAPKSYSTKTQDMVTLDVTHVTKQKGVTMHCENTKRINHENMKNMMKEFIEYGVADPLEGEMVTFKRGEHAFDGLWTGIMTKKVKPSMDKGHYIDGVAIPFGQMPSDAILDDDYPFY